MSSFQGSLSLVFHRQLPIIMDPSMNQLPPDVHQGAGLVVAAWTMGAVGCSLLAMRMYTRAVIVEKMGWDDWTMIMAVVSSIGALVCIHLMT